MSNFYVDSHAHILKVAYDDIDTVVKNYLNNGVKYIINCTSNIEESKEVNKLVNIYPSMYGTIGIHPHYAKDYTENDINYIENNINNKKIIALGETGLDYYYGFSEKEKQIELFIKQLEIAQKHKKPVVIHSRESHEDILKILKNYELKIIIHSFTGDIKYLQKYIKRGYLISLSGIITFKNSNFEKIIKAIPDEQLILETDSPHLTPVPNRGKKNEPRNVINIYNYVSNIKKVPIEILKQNVINNLNSFFDNNFFE